MSVSLNIGKQMRSYLNLNGQSHTLCRSSYGFGFVFQRFVVYLYHLTGCQTMLVMAAIKGEYKTRFFFF